MTVFARGGGDYEALRRGAVWNGIVPGRFPAAIARPTDRGEVAGLVRQARAQGQRVAVKSGGHNWRGACLRDEGLLLDLGALTRVDVEPERRMASVEPGATHKVLADAIVPHGLGFPIGHCQTVGLGGYLLAGGYGWNPRTWGPAVWSVTAVDVVTPGGDELEVDDSRHSDLFWAARGAASGFPGFVTRFHLELHPLPHIRSLRSRYPLARLPELLAWSASQEELSADIEISLIAMRDPADSSRPTVAVQATAFAASDAEAEDRLRSVAAQTPFSDELLETPSSFAVSLHQIEGEGAWVPGRRYSVDMCWVAGGYEEIGRRAAAAFERAPSPLSRIVFAWGLFPHGGPDVAQACTGKLTINVYSIWGAHERESDALNEQWTRHLMSELDPWITGFYAGEADLSASPDRPARSYSAGNWARLTAIRERYDPDRAKFGYIGES